ncbi:MAG: hypothetical protein K5694_02365, partial [Bacilli bacterium]|nr:hypothetical protein [Bacilli bacterium]
MKNKKLISLLVLSSAMILAGCGQQGGTSSESKSSEVSSGVSSEEISSIISEGSGEESSEESSEEILPDLDEALAKDYSNVLINGDEVYENFVGETETYSYSVQAVDGYSCVFSSDGYSQYASYYHDYEGKNYLYFDADPSVSTSKAGWVLRGPDTRDDGGPLLSLSRTYFSIDTFLEYFDPEWATYVPGTRIFQIFDEDAVETMNQMIFPWAYENDPKMFAILLDENNYLSAIVGFDSLTDETDTRGVYITFEDIGSQTLPAGAPAAPTAETVYDYWYQYQGTPAPEFIYLDSVTLTVPTGTLSDETHDAIIEIEDELILDWSYTPVNANMKEVEAFSSNEEVASV